MFCRANRQKDDAEELSQLRTLAEQYRLQAEKQQKEAELKGSEISKLLKDLKNLQVELSAEKTQNNKKTKEIENLLSKLQEAESQNETLKCGFVAIDAKYGELQQRYDSESREARRTESHLQEQVELRERLELRIAQLEDDLRLATRRRASDADGTNTSQADEDVLLLPASSSCASNDRQALRPEGGLLPQRAEIPQKGTAAAAAALAQTEQLETENAALKDRIVFLVAKCPPAQQPHFPS